MKALAGLLLLLALSPSGGDDLTEKAQLLLGGGLFDDAVELLAPEVESAPEDADLRGLYSKALEGTGRLDEAAHQLQVAIGLYSDREDSKAERKMRIRMRKVDPEATDVEGFWNKTTDLMRESAQKLLAKEQTERAASYLKGLMPFVSPKEQREIQTLLDLVTVRENELLDLGKADRVNGMITVQSVHYTIHAALEKDTVEVIKDMMDRLYDFYVEIYFDGDFSLAKKHIPRKATLYIHATQQEMFKEFPGEPPKELGGWWQPGYTVKVNGGEEFRGNVVHCYDTSTTTGGARDKLLSTLRHEASHQFMTALCNKGGGWAPAWLNEGTSSFFEGSRILASGEVLWPEAAVRRLRTLSDFLAKKGSGPGVEKVLEFEEEERSYPGEYYCYGWGLMYFMQEYEDPETLEKVYRPLYSEYRRLITTTEKSEKRRSPLPLFKEVFLGAGSPLGHTTLDEFIEDWQRWILKSVYPLSLGGAQAAARIKRAISYITAASTPEPEEVEAKKAELASMVEKGLMTDEGAEAAYAEFAQKFKDSPPNPRNARRLEQALNDLTYVCEVLGDEEFPDVDLLLKQRKILVRLNKELQEAHVIEAILDANYRGLHDPSPEPEEVEAKKAEFASMVEKGLMTDKGAEAAYAKFAEKFSAKAIEELKDRLFGLDSKNKVWRSAKRRRRLRAGVAIKILDRYEAHDPPFLLRASSFATDVAKALDDRKIEARAKELKARCAEAGLFVGARRHLVAGNATDWVSLFPSTHEARFDQSKTEIVVASEGGARTGRVCTTIPVTGEYEIRGVLKREGVTFGTIHGIVYSGNEEDGWMIFGIDYEGALVLRTATKEGSLISWDNWDALIGEKPDPPIAEDENPVIAIRVLPQGTLFVTIGERDTIEIELPVEMPVKSYVGVFVKGGETTLSEVIIEDFQ